VPAMTAYYNEIDLYAAEWLRNLIKAGYIPNGEVDTRSIVDVPPDDLRGFTQCHFFAGIGGWGYALRLSGWPDDRPIWTGSCPCQPFSVAGKGAGTNDPRHLWPHFHRLITACRPPVVMGEQVAGAAGYGWLDGVRADLAREGYASRGVDIPACSVDAPHIRQRLYWVATDLGNANVPHGEGGGVSSRVHPQHAHADCGGAHSDWISGRMVDAPHIRQRLYWVASDMADARCEQRSERCKSRSPTENRTDRGEENIYDQRRSDGDVADANLGQSGEGRGDACEVCGVPVAECGTKDCAALLGGSGGEHGSFWSDHVWLTGADGKSRRAQPSLPLLAHGVSNKVGRLRAYGNAIVPQVAAEVIAAFMEALP